MSLTKGTLYFVLYLTKKKSAASVKEAAEVLFFAYRLQAGCAYRAGTCACTALDALVRIDLILGISLGDSFYRALCCASTAHDASIADYICHFKSSL